MARVRTSQVSAAADCIGKISPGMSRFMLTFGGFSEIDAIEHVVRQIGPCFVTIWTWVVAQHELTVLRGLLDVGLITGARLVVDIAAERGSVRGRAGDCGDMCATWRGTFGADSVRVCKNHAKMVRFDGAGHRVLLRGSMNCNQNPRCEQLDITEGGQDFDLVSRIESELPVLRPMCSTSEAVAAAKLGNAFELSELAMFKGMKPWTR